MQKVLKISIARRGKNKKKVVPPYKRKKKKKRTKIEDIAFFNSCRY